MAVKAQVVRRLLRTKAASEYLGVSPWTLRRLVQEGKIPVVPLTEGSPWLIDVRDLDAYIDACKRSLYDLC
jgi:excisionase family DNA binding protein